MKDLILGSEGMGWRASHLLHPFFEVVYPDINIIWENTDRCDIIVRNVRINAKCMKPMGINKVETEIEKIWNDHPKPYIYRSGESWTPRRCRFHTKNVSIQSTNDDPNAIYSPYLVMAVDSVQPRKYENKNRKHLLAYCFSHKTENRENIFNSFVESVGENSCHSLGGCFGKYKSTNRRIPGYHMSGELIEAYSDYNFVIAMENTIAPGYITEKIVNAYASGAIPIYWGDSVVYDFFNKDSFIDVSDFSSIDECVEYVTNMETEKIHWMMEQPVFNEDSKYMDIINIHNSNDFYENNVDKILPLLEEVVEKRKTQ